MTPQGAGSDGRLVVRDVAVAYDQRTVLRSVDLKVEPGSITAILGPSGCGKTTLLRLIAGFLRPDAGEIALDDRTLAGPSVFVPPEKRNIGIVAQEGALFPHLTVAENVGFGLPRSETRDTKVREWLERVGLVAHAGSRPRELSGGQQQRVALARALAAQPRVVLLDEPFSSLDTHLREQVRAEVVDVLRSTGVTTILVTHDREEALATADRVAVMFDGMIMQEGTPQELYTQPRTVEVASFVGELCVLEGSVAEDTADTALGHLPVRRLLKDGPARRSVLACRPEQLQIEPGFVGTGPFSTGTGPGSHGTVERSRYLGARVQLTIRLHDDSRVFTYVDGASGVVAPHVGDRVRLKLTGSLLELLGSRQ